jgi:hypothetical protein
VALSGFEIAVGGITSIPVVSGLILLGYKSFGESSLDASKLKPKKKPAVKQEVSESENKISAPKNEKPKSTKKPSATVKEKSASAEKPLTAKE